MITAHDVATMISRLHTAAEQPEGTATRVMARRELLHDAAYLIADLAAERQTSS